jgi:hypothetical protein
LLVHRRSSSSGWKRVASAPAVPSTDEYNSLSIEGYQVTAELIERVRSSSSNPEKTLTTGSNGTQRLPAVPGLLSSLFSEPSSRF